ncbi:MAG: polymer-forming cytoskeletal protein [Saprospiraceae bacterium]
MFGSTKESEDSKKNTSAATGTGALNALVSGTSVEGTLQCDSDFRIDGTIKGKLRCKAKVIIGPSGVVDGEIHCQNAVVEGRFKGKMTVTELLNIRETAEVEGEISTNKLLVQSGAHFNVSCRMEAVSSNGVLSSEKSKTAADDKKTSEKVA